MEDHSHVTDFLMEDEENVDDQGTYSGEMLGKMRDGKGVMRYENGNVYEGEWKNDLFEGKGKLIKAGVEGKEGTRYEGEWKEGKYNGNGVILYSNDEGYSGFWKNGKKHGLGTYTRKIYTFTGEFEGNKMMNGTLEYSNHEKNPEWLRGTKYIGPLTIFKTFPKLHGAGVHEKKNGYRAEGCFNFGSKEGKFEVSTNNSKFIGNFKKNKRDGPGLDVHKDEEGTIIKEYNGTFKQSKYHGKGIYTDKKCRYDGEFNMNSREGVCNELKFLETNCTFKGTMYRNQMHGEKCEMDTPVYHYKGSYVRGKISGQGTKIFKATGDEYTGEWKDGKLNGEKDEVKSDKCHYIGGHKKGEKNGMGIYTDKKCRYDGEWKNGSREGVCNELKFLETNCTFKGTMYNNRMHGEKCEMDTPVYHYKGSFKGGKRNGYGILTYKDTGDVYAGEWKNGKKNGEGKQTYKSGAVYEGEWHENQKHGEGKYFFHGSSSTYFGSFSGGMQNGHGVLTFKSKQGAERIYDGNFVKNKMDGEGKFTFENGNMYVGQFRNNRRVKEGEGKYFFLGVGSTDFRELEYIKTSKKKRGKFKNPDDYTPADFKKKLGVKIGIKIRN